MKEFFDRLFAFSITIGDVELKPFDIFINIILPALMAYFAYRIIFYIVKKLLTKAFKEEKKICDKIGRIIKIILRLACILAIIIIITNYFGTQIPHYFLIFWSGLKEPLFTSGSAQISIISLILVIPILYGAWWVSQRSMRFIDKRLFSRMALEKSMRFSMTSLIRYVVLIIALIFGLSLIGIDLSSIAVILGVLGIGIGFGLQNVVANFFAGLVIVFERPIKVGDRILVNGLEGDVVRIRLRSTVITTLTNETIVIPNSQLIEHHIHNYSFENPEIIIVNTVQVSYSADLKQVQEILLDVAKRNPFFLPAKESKVRVQAFADSGIVMELRTWIKSAHNKLEALAWTNMEIWDTFRRHKVTIPFQQVDVHLKQEPGQPPAGG